MLGQTQNTKLFLGVVPTYDSKTGTNRTTLIRRSQDQDSNAGPRVYEVLTKEQLWSSSGGDKLEL